MTQPYIDVAFKLIARHGIPAIVLGGLLVWLLGATPWPSPMAQIQQKLDLLLWRQAAICRRMFKGEEERLRWLGCSDKRPVE